MGSDKSNNSNIEQSEDEIIEKYDYTNNFCYRLEKKFCEEFHINLLVSFEVHNKLGSYLYQNKREIT